MNEANIPNDKRDAEIYLKGYLDAVEFVKDFKENADCSCLVSYKYASYLTGRALNDAITKVNKKLNGDCNE